MMASATSVHAPSPVSHEKAAREVTKLQRKIARAVAGGKHRRARHLTTRYLQSYSAKLTATRRANHDLSRHLRVNPKLLPEIAAGLDPWRGTDEVVVVSAKEKRSGGYRLVMNFGIRNRALQILVRGALGPWARFHPKQFTFQGVPAAADAVMKALEQGHHWTAQLDIRNCFGSFDGEAVCKMLPVADEVVRRVILSRYLNLEPSKYLAHTFDTTEGPDCDLEILVEARRGIPQGSAVSSFVAEMMLANVADSLSPEACVEIYADNMLSMASEKEEAVSMILTLRMALMCHPAGPLLSKVDEPRKADVGFEFLGYRFSCQKGVPKAEPSEDNLARFEVEYETHTWKICQNCHTPKPRKRWVKDARNHVRSWCSSFRLWDGVAKLQEERMAEIDELGKGTAPDVTFMRFKFHDDQNETIDEALARAKKEGETTVNSVAMEYALAGYLAGPGKFGSQGENIHNLDDMIPPLKAWFARVKVAAEKDPIPEKTPQDTALTFIFAALDQVFPNIDVTSNTD